MQKNRLKPNCFLIILCCFFAFWLSATNVLAETTSKLEDSLYQDKTKIVLQQLHILKSRAIQAQNELSKLQRQQENPQSDLSLDLINKNMLTQTQLDIAIAKSNLESIGIELADSQQTITRLESETQEIENQLNVYSIFGLKIANNNIGTLSGLRIELKFQKNLLTLEKTRSSYLQQLQGLSNNILQMNQIKYSRIEGLLKSRTMIRMKEQQAHSELVFQQQQNYWLQQQNILYAQLNSLEHVKDSNRTGYAKIENDIFYATENVNFTYLQMLIARYQDQIQQLKVSISHSNSITLLNKVMEQAQTLGKQLVRVNNLLTKRMSILQNRKNYLTYTKSSADYLEGLSSLEQQYKKAATKVANLDQELIAFRVALDQALQQELSARQGLPGFGAKAWLDLGAEILLVPSLTFQIFKSLTVSTLHGLHDIQPMWWLMLLSLEMVWLVAFYFLADILNRAVTGLKDHEFGHINLKWLLIKSLRRSLIDIAIIGNVAWLFYFCNIPAPNFSFLMNLGLVWIFFKVILTIAQLCLIENVHDRAGHDVVLYHRLKWSFIFGGVITALTVFIHQLPLIYEIKDLFDRLFLLFLLSVSVFLLKSWEVLPGLILPHVDDKHTYIKRVIRLLCLLIPFILFVNSAIGLFGFVNFVQTISWYESIFLVGLVGYLFVRGLLSDAMDFISQILIRHVANGWLWTEALLKPLDKVLRIVLFVSAWLTLFHFYGWDRQSPVVSGLIDLLNYHIVDMLNTSITLLSILELIVIVSVLFWAARWTREFMYRFLLSRTKDLGVRNSIAILSQYTMILIGIFICLRVLGIDFRALTAVAAALAFGVGLGLRDLVNNFACGFLLLLERPLRVGDTVTIGEYEGEVTHIGGRAVTVRTWDHMDVLVPNAEIFSKSFLNWTAKDHIVRTVISIKISRHDRPEDIQAVIHKVLIANSDVLKDPAPEVYLKELTDGLTEFEVRYFINLRMVKSRIGVRSAVLVAVWEVFETHGIKPPYPHHEIFLKSGDGMSLATFAETFK